MESSERRGYSIKVNKRIEVLGTNRLNFRGEISSSTLRASSVQNSESGSNILRIVLFWFQSQ